MSTEQGLQQSEFPDYDQSTKPDCPTWDDDVQALFVAPFWIEPEEKRRKVGRHWIGAMKFYGSPIPPWAEPPTNLGLDNYDQVKLQAVTIYQHVASRSMPITKDPTEYWPTAALELLRNWINQGCRKTKSDPIVAPKIPLSPVSTAVFKTRKDIRDLTPDELATYRTKLQEVLEVDSLESKWQELGELRESSNYAYSSDFIDKCRCMVVSPLSRGHFFLASLLLEVY